MENSFPHRIFQLWEYRVSHGSLLIRSPQTPSIATNIDLICVGVEYIAVPTLIRGLELTEPTEGEIERLCRELGEPVPPARVRIVATQGRRYPIVAVSFRLSENREDIFSSPFSF